MKALVYMLGQTMPCHCVDCEDPESHLSRAHICSKCQKRGHGKHECGPGLRGRLRRTELSRRGYSRLPSTLHCNVHDCPDTQSHITRFHQCDTCLGRGGSCVYPCIRSSLRLTPPPPPTYLKGVVCPLCRSQTTAELFVDLYTGLDCLICHKSRKLCALQPCGHVCSCRDCLLKLTLSSDNA